MRLFSENRSHSLVDSNLQRPVRFFDRIRWTISSQRDRNQPRTLRDQQPTGSIGMGEVYQATDSKLGRRVAIKLLPTAFVSDAERLSRFQREAQVLASLNHSNIAQIYGPEESSETRGIVMELVEGETLQARLQGAPVPVDE